MRPGLIHKHQSPNIEARGQPSPQSSRSLIAFLGYLGLFLSGHSPGSLRILRLIVASETSRPLSSKKAWQCSDKLSSGLDFSCSGSHCLKALQPVEKPLHASSESPSRAQKPAIAVFWPWFGSVGFIFDLPTG